MSSLLILLPDLQPRYSIIVILVSITLSLLQLCGSSVYTVLVQTQRSVKLGALPLVLTKFIQILKLQTGLDSGNDLHMAMCTDANSSGS